MTLTGSSKLECKELLIVDWIVHPLNYFIVSERMPEAIRISYVTFASFFCGLIEKLGGSGWCDLTKVEGESLKPRSSFKGLWTVVIEVIY